MIEIGTDRVRQDIQRPGLYSVSPDGGSVILAVTGGGVAPRAGPVGCLWHVPLGPGAARAVTSGSGLDTAPVHAASGEVVFLSDRQTTGRFAPYILRGDDITGPVGQIDGSVEKTLWADADTLVCLAADEGLDTASSDGARPLRWSGVDGPTTADGTPRRRLFRVDTGTGATEAFGPESGSVWDFDVAPGGGVVAIHSADPTERGWHEALLVHIAGDGAETVLYRPDEQIQCPAISPDGTCAAFLEGPASDRNLVAGRLTLCDLATGTITRPCQGVEDLSHVAWLPDGTLSATGWQGFGTRHLIVTRTGDILSDRHDDATLGPTRFTARVDPLADGTALAVGEAVGQPPDLMRRTEAGWAALTSFGADHDDPPHATTTLDWTSPDGTRIDGLLLTPDGAPATGPLVVVVHGGPTSAARHAHDPASALRYVAAGYRVLLPNYRGSVGRGRSFARGVIGDPGGADFADVVAGVDHCAAAGFADPARIGITGVSYGGYLSAWATATSDRFAASVVISGIGDLLGCNYTCNHAFSEWVAGGPVSDPAIRALLTDRSPLSHIHRATTPTLLLHGALDRCTPVGQADALYAALLRHGVPTRQVTFPREGHDIRETAHRARLSQEAVAWFDTHLGGAT